MAKTTIQITDRNFRIVVPYHIRKIEGIKIGDVLEVTFKKANEEKAFKEQFDEMMGEKLSLLGKGKLAELKDNIKKNE